MKARPCLALLACVGMEAVTAHHSPAMFDQSQRVTLQGTVRLFQWRNPHTYIQLLVTDAAGKQVEWSIEAAAPIYLQQAGWKRSSVRAGDEVSLVIAPLRRQGKSPAGLLIEARGADGKVLGNPREAP